jgi:nucleoside-diphosphate-sugar epimerase
MRILITGATGFIGTELTTRAVAMGHTVVGLSRSTSRLAEMPTRSGVTLLDVAKLEELVQAKSIDATVHLAWTAEPRRYLGDVRGNAESLAGAAKIVAELATLDSHRLVIAGTCLEGARASSASQTPYAAAKRAAHGFAMSAGRTTSLSVCCAHLFSVYGPGEHPDRFIPSIVRAMLTNTRFEVRGHRQVRDWVHVTDAANALLALASSDVEGGVDVGTGEGRSLADVGTAIGAITDRPELVGTMTEAHDLAFSAIADPDPLAAATGWRAGITVEDGLRATVSWWRSAIIGGSP